MKLLILMLVAICTATVVFAQEAAVTGGDVGLIPGISVQHQLWVTWAVIAFKYLSEFYSSVRNGGGLKRIIMSFWLGENLPKVVATDYKEQLSNPPFPPA